MQDKDNVYNIYYTLNKFFTLLFCYWGFGQPDKENYYPYFNHLNFSLPAFATCRCTWDVSSCGVVSGDLMMDSRRKPLLLLMYEQAGRT